MYLRAGHVTNQLSTEQAIALQQVLAASGVDTSTLKASNPFSPEFGTTKTGQYVQMVISSNAPQLAADLKREAGHIDAVPSLAMAAALAEKVDPASFIGALREEYIAANPQLVAEQQQEAQQAEIAAMDRMASEMEYKRIVRECNGDEAAAKIKMRHQQEAQKQADAQAEIDREMNARAEQRNREIVERNKRLAVLSQGGIVQP